MNALNGLQPIETKAAGDDEDDFEQQLEGLKSDLETSIEVKVAKMIADAIKPVTDAQIDAEKKANRPFACAGNDNEADERKLEMNRDLIAMFFRQSADNAPADLRKKMAALVEDMQAKAMSVGSDPDGGYLVSEYRSPIIRKKLLDLSPMRRIAGGTTLPYGDAWEEPLDDDEAGAGWVGETEARPETSTPQVGVWRVDLHEMYAMPKVTQKLLDLSNYDLGAWLEGKIGDRFGQLEGSAFILGNGIKKPRGLLTYPVSALGDVNRGRGEIQTVPSGHATLLTPDGLVTMTWALRAPYRQNARWMMNSKTAAAISLFKDQTDRYLWQQSLAEGQPSRLLGYAVEIDESMPDVGAGTMPIAFGDFSRAYFIVDWSGMKLLRDPYTQKPHVLFYAYKRTGGAVRDFDAVKLQAVGV